MRKCFRVAVVVLASFIWLGSVGSVSLAGDWPQWRCDPGRSAVTAEALPEKLQLRWVRRLPAAQRAWTDASNARLYFDVSYEPIVVGKLLIVASMNDDSVTAYDTGTGERKWRFFTAGPVRLAPAAADGKVYVASDDGYLYCLGVADGKLLWKFRGGPADRKVLGHGRLVSAWPARGGPVVYDGKVYFAASIWPVMGTFLHALDARTGRVVWTNSGTGSQWTTQPHGAPSFAGVAPQGYLAASEKYLVVAGGRSSPAVFDRKTGRLVHFAFRGGKGGGGYNVGISGELMRNGTALNRLDDGKDRGRFAGVIAAERAYAIEGDRLAVSAYPPVAVTTKDRKGKTSTRYVMKPVAKARLTDGPKRLMLMAGNRLYGPGADGRVMAVEVDPGSPAAAKVTWIGKVDGEPWSMLAGDDKLFVVTTDGAIHCFAAAAGAARTRVHGLPAAIMRATYIRKKSGYTLLLGLGDGQRVERLLAAFDSRMIVIDADAGRVDAFRRRYADKGLYGLRVSALVGDPLTYPLPPYLADAIFIDASLAAEGATPAVIRHLYRSLRPYGGTLHVHGAGTGTAVNAMVAEALRDTGEKPVISVDTTALQIRRPGPLPGAADWTHQYANAANTAISDETLVKAPLGLLWFGGASNDSILPRHGHGPSPQVAGGRLFIEGPNMLRAVDVYTGRVLWEKSLPGVGTYYDTTSHFPGAGEIGSNYVSLPDAVYVMMPAACLMLDPATGETLKTFALPAAAGAGAKWGSIRVYQNLLIATAGPMGTPRPARKKAPPKGTKPKPEPKPKPVAKLEDVPGVKLNDTYAAVSRMLVAMNRKTGALLWCRPAVGGWRHNNIAAGAGKLFCIDSLSAAKLAELKRRGLVSPPTGALYALDAGTGRVIWETGEDVFGTFLSYAAAHDVLLQGGSAFRDRAWDEARQGIVAYRGADGTVLWKDRQRAYSGPLLIWRDQFITNGNAGGGFGLTTGEPAGWSWSRMYGCNTIIGGQNLLTFRSGAAGYYDLSNFGGTGNLGGFKSSCTANLIVADGVLNAPDYTRTCSCAYQNQASLAFVHDPSQEMWTFAGTLTPGKGIGLNFGAPGDRKAASGTFWLDWPDDSRRSPEVKASIEGGRPFRHHSSLMSGEGLTWVGASGLTGVEKITFTPPGVTGTTTVRLYFAEPDAGAKPGDRVFSVAVNGKTALRDFDVTKEAGGPRRVVVKEIRGLSAAPLTVTFGARKGEPLICGIEVIPSGGESPVKRTIKYSAPQEVFDAAIKASRAGDHETFVGCLSPKGLEAYSTFILWLVSMGAGKDDLPADKAEQLDAFVKAHGFSARNELRPPEGADMKAFVASLAAKVKDKRALVVDHLRRQAEHRASKPRKIKPAPVLAELKIDGTKATGREVVTDESGKSSGPVKFDFTDGSWGISNIIFS